MMRRLVDIVFLGSALCVACVPALADESWDCTFTPASVPANGIAKIQIEGRVLNWWTPPPPAKIAPGMKWAKFQYRLLESNDIGIVAAFSQSHVYPSDGPPYRDIGPVIGATILTVDKKSGDLRIGSVMSNGEHDLMTGHCQRK